MKIIPERKINHCIACDYNQFDACKHPQFDCVMYIPKDDRMVDFPSWCPLEDV